MESSHQLNDHVNVDTVMMTPKQRDQQHEAQLISQQCHAAASSLVDHHSAPGISAAQNILPHCEIVHSSKPTIVEDGGWFGGAIQIAKDIGEGVGNKVSSVYHTTIKDAGAVAASIENIYEHPEKIIDADKKVVHAIGSFAHEVVTDPSQALADTGHVIAGTASVIAHATEASARWIANHKIETVGIAAVAIAEVGSAGMATPFVTLATAAAEASLVPIAFNAADTVYGAKGAAAVLLNPDGHTPSEVSEANSTVAKAAGTVVTDGTLLIGAAAGKVLKTIFQTGEQAAKIDEVVVAVAPSDTGGVAKDVAADAAKAEDVIAKGVIAATAPHTAVVERLAAVPKSEAVAPPVTAVVGPGDTAPPPTAPTGDTQPIHTDAKGDSSHTDAPKPADPTDEFGNLLDESGRPVSDNNLARIEEKHPRLEQSVMAESLKLVMADLKSRKAVTTLWDRAKSFLFPGESGDTPSVMDQFNHARGSEVQKKLQLNVLAELRHSMLTPDANGVVSVAQQNNWEHTIGEMSEGLRLSAKHNFSGSETQDEVLAAMLTDSHKQGWSRWDPHPPGQEPGNFFTHHLDGALTAKIILSRYLGDGITPHDLEGIYHAILEHQIGPPAFMGSAYANEIRNGMRHMLGDNAQDSIAGSEADIQDIQKKISNPFQSELEPDSLGGYRIKFTAEQRKLLREYVGPGTENWHVPDARNWWNNISLAVIAADSLDNYFPLMVHGKTVKGSGKIAALNGPNDPVRPDFWINDSINKINKSAMETIDMFSGAEKKNALKRLAEADKVYEAAKEKTGVWLHHRLGLPEDASLADVPYYGKPLIPPDAPPAGADAAAKAKLRQEWLNRDDVKLGIEIQQQFAQELMNMRKIDTSITEEANEIGIGRTSSISM